MSLDQEQTRGWQAQQLLDNELLKEALDVIEKDVIAQWEQCPARDNEGKEQLWQLYKTAKKFRLVLQGVVETGKLASSKLKEAETFRDKLRRII